MLDLDYSHQGQHFVTGFFVSRGKESDANIGIIANVNTYRVPFYRLP